MVVKFLEQAKAALLALDPEYSTDIKDAIANLAKTLFRQDYPDKYFGEALGTGCYKEAYKVSPHCVIKFCTFDNPTEREENLYNAALDANLVTSSFLLISFSFLSLSLLLTTVMKMAFTKMNLFSPAWKSNISQLL